MHRLRRLSLGELAVLATVGVVAALYFTHGGEMYTPGALNAQTRGKVQLGGVSSHAEIAGNCAACHVAPWSGETMADRCLTCHSEVRRQIAGHRPLHGRFADGMECRRCHTEHRGADAALTSLAHFDHDCAAFKLTGKHRTLDCASCHTGTLYRGTAQACVSCHAEPRTHLGRFGTACGQCHSTSTWNDASLTSATLAKFDHDATGFKLTGQHRTVDCRACHISNVFKGTAQACVSCHAEPTVPVVHKAQYGAGCVKCHTTTTWAGAVFIHGFPMTHGGGGKKVKDCVMCHTTANDFQTYTCYVCHRHDPVKTEEKHLQKRLATAANIRNCAVCHPTGRKRPPAQVRADGVGLELWQGCPEAYAFLSPQHHGDVLHGLGTYELFDDKVSSSPVVKTSLGVSLQTGDMPQFPGAIRLANRQDWIDPPLKRTGSDGDVLLGQRLRAFQGSWLSPWGRTDSGSASSQRYTARGPNRHIP